MNSETNNDVRTAVLVPLIAIVVCLSALCLCHTADTLTRVENHAQEDHQQALESMYLSTTEPRRRLPDSELPSSTLPRSTNSKNKANMLQTWFFERIIERPESVRSLENVLQIVAMEDDAEANTGNTSAKTSRNHADQISSIRTATGERECCICLEVYRAGDTVVWAKTGDCNHIFHKACARKWLQDHHTCPLCRCKLVDR